MNEIVTRWLIREEPYYRETGREISWFEAAWRRRLPVLLKGPTGCGKTRFVEYMAWRLGRPLVTVACNEDLSAADLIGRHLLDETGTVWHDGPLTMAARHGAICYLDEVVEARADTTVAIHPLSDTRRVLPIDRRGELLHAHPDFMLVMSYNPGYQSAAKDLKMSTRQRFTAIDFHYPEPDVEAAIVAREGGTSGDIAQRLVAVAQQSRELPGYGLSEGMSTRMLVHAAALIGDGIDAHSACRIAMVSPLADDEDVLRALSGFVDAQFGA
ncbi:MAG TPA: CbbQ/NirQ/NorQ/GpvN family protein [Paraburkholderia sp.]|jgi:nitric oxide reductase NorQ protein|nr:CbbQ/NirQ/NorQ/GpvN family protein [Paraburkholderia sp.]